MLFVVGGVRGHSEQTPLKTFVHLGDIGQIALPVAGGALALLSADDRSFSELISAIATTQLVVYGLKVTVKEKRPHGNSLNSFPSAHTSAAFSGASFIYKKYGPALGVPATCLASLVAVSRVVGGWHYTQDVVAGACLGILINQALVTGSFKNAEYSSDGNLLRLAIRY